MSGTLGKMPTYCVLHNGCDPLEVDAAGVRRRLRDTLGLIPAPVEEADLVVFMGCTFSQQKEEEFERHLVSLCQPSNGRLVIASGCYLEKAMRCPNVKYCRASEIVELVASTLDLAPISQGSASLPIQAGSGIVLVSEGCYGCCTFCSVRLVRGQHRSRPVNEIIQDIRVLFHHNGSVKLAGQDVAAYGRDIGKTLWDLLLTISEEFPNIQVELGPLGPEWLIRSKNDELSLLASKNISGNVHVPLQSASNTVLRRMQRRYTYEEFGNLWGRLCQVGVQKLSTDLMAGFPGETIEDHEKTLDFLATHRLAFAQVFMYEPRPGTEAALREPLPRRTRMERTMELIAAYLSTSARFRSVDIENLALSTSEMLFNTNVQLEEDITDES
ncbi:MAG: radical SAM protein [Deltaproteobacteria bacterium]|nr:radical SAM protein [Deltaproteobacteria bacterium]